MKKATGKHEAEQGAILVSHKDKVKFTVKYDEKKWPAKREDGTPGPKRHLKEGSVHILHVLHAKTLEANGQGTITEFLNDKRDKNLDKHKGIQETAK